MHESRNAAGTPRREAMRVMGLGMGMSGAALFGALGLQATEVNAKSSGKGQKAKAEKKGKKGKSGPQGPAGSTGPAGPQGPAGLQGPAGAITGFQVFAESRPYADVGSDAGSSDVVGVTCDPGGLVVGASIFTRGDATGIGPPIYDSEGADHLSVRLTRDEAGAGVLEFSLTVWCLYSGPSRNRGASRG